MTGINVRENLVMVDIACNDPDNGCFAGRAEQITVGNQFIELEARRAMAPRFREIGRDQFALAGHQWLHHGCVAGIGNWCWNGYWMKIPDAVQFFIWLHKRGFYSLTTGESCIFNLWKLDKPLDAEFLDRLLGKPSTHEF